MTFSANKIGTIADVKEHLRDHHGPSESGDRVRKVAVDSALAELDILEREGFTHAQANISGSHYDFLATAPDGTPTGSRHMGMGYSVSIASVDPATIAEQPAPTSPPPSA